MCFTKNAPCWHLLAIPHFQIRRNQINTHKFKDGYISQIECRVHVHLSLISYIPFIHLKKHVYNMYMYIYNIYIYITSTDFLLPQFPHFWNPPGVAWLHPFLPRFHRGAAEADQRAHHRQGRAAQEHAFRHQGPAAVGIPHAKITGDGAFPWPWVFSQKSDAERAKRAYNLWDLWDVYDIWWYMYIYVYYVYMAIYSFSKSSELWGDAWHWKHGEQ